MFRPEAGGFAGNRPAASSFLDRPRKEPKKGARGYAPATPRRLRLAFGQSRRRRDTDERTSLPQPASRRAAGAMPLPASLRNRSRSAFGEARTASPCLPSPFVGRTEIRLSPQGTRQLRPRTATDLAFCRRARDTCAALCLRAVASKSACASRAEGEPPSPVCPLPASSLCVFRFPLLGESRLG